MVRSKVKPEYIEDDSARRATFKKRRKGLMKKAMELSTLCGVETCAIVYGENSDEPEVWPSPVEAYEVLTRYREMPQYKQSRHRETLESSTNEMIRKLEHELEKKRLENWHKDLHRLTYAGLRGQRPSNLSVDDLNGIAWMTKQKMNEIDELIEKQKMESIPKEVGTMSPMRTIYPPQGPQIEHTVTGDDLSNEVEMISGGMWGGTFPHGVELLSIKGDNPGPSDG